MRGSSLGGGNRTVRGDGVRGGGVKLLPDARQRCLLRVAVLDDGTARREWAEWRSAGGTLDELDDRSQALLPQLYRRLSAMGVDDPDMARLKGTYRHRWCENVGAMRAGQSALAVLAGAGVETMIFKGMALMVAYGRDPGARPMGDVDVVVKPVDARRSLELLLRAGFAVQRRHRALRRSACPAERQPLPAGGGR